MKTKRAVIVQCRLSSTRLPGKAIKELDGKPVLAWALNSMKKVPADKYFVATDEESYPVLQPICKQNGFECFAGDLNDVLKRFCDLIKTLKVETIIRATADNPFLFYEAAQASVEDFEERNSGKVKCDYLTYSGLPHGSGVEIFSAKSLLEAAEQTEDPYDHEHVGPALYKHQDKFKCDFIPAPVRFNHPELRTTIDTAADFMRAVLIVNAVKANRGENTAKKNDEPFTTEEVLAACKSKKVMNPVVLVPSVKKGQGTGHLHRCLTSAINKDFFVYIPKDCTLEETFEIIKAYKEKGLKDYQIINSLPDETYQPVIVTDSFKLSKEEIDLYAKSKMLISLDEGSEFTQNCDYLLDIIPSYDCQRKANLFDTSYIEKPKNVRKEIKRNIDKVLICLGGEDPAGLTLPAAKAIMKLLPAADITAVVSKIDDYKNILNINFTGPIENLREKIFEYDLVITHYGLTAFEAISAGCGVIMLATSKLHEKLAQKYNFDYIPFGKIDEVYMQKALESDRLYPNSELSSEQKNLGDMIQKLSFGGRLLCPVCQNNSTAFNKIISRNETRTYRRCRDCGIVYMSFSAEEEKKYEKAYFFEDYKKQYGKTYEEDFESIKNQCVRRINNIKAFSNKKGKNYLDIGCAYGPSLAAGAEKGLNPFGTDIAEDAVHYVKNKLHFPASCSAFPQIDTEKEFGISKFDYISMWYVIEHFKNLDSVLNKVSQIIKKDGIFAFSTPSGQGISAVSNCDNFYKISPIDHFSVWEQKYAAKILKKYGFEVVKVVSTGHHPERFPYCKKNNVQKNSLMWKMIDSYSKTHGLGDTVEIYCRKK